MRRQLSECHLLRMFDLIITHLLEYRYAVFFSSSRTQAISFIMAFFFCLFADFRTLHMRNKRHST